eukprot:5318990-Karenia_brevis.AAC.2
MVTAVRSRGVAGTLPQGKHMSAGVFGIGVNGARSGLAGSGCILGVSIHTETEMDIENVFG